jgi:protein phosphatase
MAVTNDGLSDFEPPTFDSGEPLFSSGSSQPPFRSTGRPSPDVQTQCRQFQGSDRRQAPAAESVGCETLWALPVGRDLQIEYAGSSDVGRVRKNNEDRFVIAELSREVSVRAGNGRVTAPQGLAQATVLAVADGLGGHTSGELAGRIAVDSLLRHLAHSRAWPAPEAGDASPALAELGQAVEAGQEAIVAHTIAHPEAAGMATTLTAACVVGRYALLAHAGDSRCYLYRDGELRRLTADHTVAQRLLERGDLTAEEVEGSRWNHVLWKVLGGSGEPVEADLSVEQVFPGDVLLLCTDGLTKHVDDAQLAAMLAQGKSAASICRRMIEAANEAGGSDNVTAVVARLGIEIPLPPESNPNLQGEAGTDVGDAARPTDPGSGSHPTSAQKSGTEETGSEKSGPAAAAE